MKRIIAICMFAALGVSFTGAHAGGKRRDVVLATTTSTMDSGLLDVLIPMFEKKSGYRVKTIAVGSGQAMAMGERGEADVLLVHSPEAEARFMKGGYGVTRMVVMHNSFMIVGPREDQAKIRGQRSTTGALGRIAAAGALFISRGDDSGTHVKELGLWRKAGISTTGARWYQETGLGMGQSLAVASEKRGYILVDRGTYLALKKNLDLDVMVEGDSSLLNIYHVIQVSPEKFPRVNGPGGADFASFMISQEAQRVIRDFGVDRFGSPLFSPDALARPR